MSGVFIETCSNRWLLLFVAALVACQATFFLLGGLVAPRPATHQTISGLICHAKSTDSPDQWYQPRGRDACHLLDDIYGERARSLNLQAENVVFAFQLPLPRNGQKLAMSRWFQSMLGILQPDIAYAENFPLDPHAKLRLYTRIGYRNEGETRWHEIARSNETRFLDCQLDRRLPDYRYFCAPMPLFELGSVHHQEYLLNIRIPQEVAHGHNTHIGKLEELELVEIHQTGGFSMVWYWTKTVMTPCVLSAVLFFWRCVQGLPRRPAMLEKMLLALGLAMLQLCVPLEWLTLYVDMPYFMVLSDLRQGIFHSVLMAFWIIFAGEHMMDDGADRNRFVAYWKHLSAVACGCICLFVFDMCERGVQLGNPFHSIWSTPEGTKLGLTFIGLAACSACSYFVFLCWMVYRVFRQIQSKKTSIHTMNVRKRLFYQGLIFRFQFLMGISVVCAGLTVAAFIMGQWTESQWKWGMSEVVEHSDDDDNETLMTSPPALESTSSFFVGVFGMWCLYVISLLILYSPNCKYYGAELLVQNGQTLHNSAIATTAAAADDDVHETAQVWTQGGDPLRARMLNEDAVGGEEIEFRTLTPRTIAAAVRETDILDADNDDDDDEVSPPRRAAVQHVGEIRENVSLTAFVSKAAQD